MGDSTTYSRILKSGTYADYKAIEVKDQNVLYFCTDKGKLFKGTIDFTDNFIWTNSTAIPTPANAVPGKIYYEADTKLWKTLNETGTAFIQIGNPIDAVGDNTATTITINSSDATEPSSKNVWLYGQKIKSEVIGGGDVVKTVAADQTTPAAIIVTKGDDSTSQVVIPDVVIGIADDTTNDAQIIFTKSDDSTTAVSISGVVTTPTWDSTNLKLTLPVSGGTAVEVNIPKDIFLQSGSYDVTNRQIVLVLNDASSTEIRFNVGDMVDIYVAKDTTSIDTTIAWNATSGKYEISGDINLSATADNGAQIAADGLYVPTAGFATTTDLATLEGSHNNLAEAALTWGTF